MTKIFLVANWKLYVSARRSVTLAAAFAQRFGKKRFSRAQQILCPSDPILEEVGKMLSRSGIALGAQNIGRETRGAATGQISAADLRQIGCRYVLVGHSERRSLSDTDAIVAKKLRLAAANGLVPILCVGESLAVRRRGAQRLFVVQQLRRALAGFSRARFLVAYEPVWAISKNGKTRGACSPAAADQMRIVIENTLRRARRKPEALLYGGSVDGSNIKAYVHEKSFDGALVGFASTKVGEYGTMIRMLTGG